MRYSEIRVFGFELVTLLICVYAGQEHVFEFMEMAYSGDLEYPGFKDLNVGDSIVKVLDVMGKPSEKSLALSETVSNHDKKFYESAKQYEPKVSLWFIYHGGFEMMFLIGFDSYSRVVFVDRSGT